MARHTLIKNARLVNEGKTTESDLLITGERISKIAPSISPHNANTKIIDAMGKYLLPGIIDDQVHFREPGLTYKGTIYSESRAALAGGVTSYIEQPNTNPPATTIELLHQKYHIAEKTSWANFGFNLGASNDNIEEIKKAASSKAAGIKVFMGSSTGNMLVDNPATLEALFRDSPLLIITHCEDETTIRQNQQKYIDLIGRNQLTARYHPLIRSHEACLLSTQTAISLAKKFNSRLHIYHISTAQEAVIFENKVPLEKKKITAEACIHHLWFSDADYADKGNLIKWNPSVKTTADREAIWKALLENRIDIIATDHAPHTLEEKQKPYIDAPSGGPLVQHSLNAMMEFVKEGRITIERLVEKMCHNPSILFRIKDRGFIREGYFADLVLLHPAMPYTVNKDNIFYSCGWSPFEGISFKSRVTHTFVNGQLMYENGKFSSFKNAMSLEFTRD
ncbi:dihydroorotase [Schleiferia thermophila]|jgi:dihydroorotase|uniref:Dihydroorotase n=1 Tax=Schleiferia thermophila TaxID=884107 RepID=A0A369A3U1_9FLAO|nr:dihydroorotase [Schleiferia thermophila]KFD39685.1 dihydroorotase [Schleiferia thermophila str. Yellowstone]RCX03865.1 dihydroorotase [Schleiferia thermophila]GCD80097.1 dihydroorotase [Schleiferia thermophila]